MALLAVRHSAGEVGGRKWLPDHPQRILSLHAWTVFLDDIQRADRLLRDGSNRQRQGSHGLGPLWWILSGLVFRCSRGAVGGLMVGEGATVHLDREFFTSLEVAPMSAAPE